MRSTFRRVFYGVGVVGLLHAAMVQAEPVHASLLSDDIALGHLDEGGSVATVSGDIRVEEAHAFLRVSTISGDIKIGRLAEEAVVSSVSGDVSVGETYKRLQADTVSGDLRIDRIFGSVVLKSVSGDIDVALGAVDKAAATPRSLALTTVSGDVLFHFSQSFSGTIDVWARQSESERQLPIVQSLGLNVDVGPWEESGLSALGLVPSNRSRKIHVSGRLGDGQDRLVINTTTGTVRLVQN